ncbi:tripartite tricarboxylate transporter substrate binding protein [Phaeobacter sp. SYSU ZJ3003]|uniref:tripartite tricarboxylate transporter substrate binding protein n=1 Tax=Phaeobacter sp. SYSU ZJ3003 TaxID=2109330 RepID=UPI00351C173D
MFKSLIAAAGIAAASVCAAPASAGEWAPEEPINLQIGFGAGGGTDTLGRAIAAAMEEQTGWDIVVENKPGGGGVAMFSGVATASPDGLTLGMGVTTPTLMGITERGDSLPFNIESFDYLATVVLGPLAVVAPADAPYNTFDELVTYAAGNDGALLGHDTTPQSLIIRAIEGDKGAGLVPVPHNSGAEMIQGLLGGNLQAAFLGGAHIQYVNSGDLKMLAVGTSGRHGYSPDTTSLSEQGYPFAVEPYFYIAAPAGLPEDTRASLAKAIDAAINSEAVTELVTNMMQVPPSNIGPDGTAQMMTDGLASMQKLFELTR